MTSSLALESAAPARLHLPGAQALAAYPLAYWSAALQLLAGSHRLQPRQAGRYVADVEIAAPLRQRWQQMLNISAQQAEGVPLIYGQGVGTLLYMRLFSDLGINLRHLLHLQHRVSHGQGAAALAAAGRQQFSVGLHRVVRLAEDRALVELRTDVLDMQGQRLAVVEDGFVIRQLPSADLQGMPGDRQAMRELLGLRRRTPQLLQGDGAVQTVSLVLHADLGRRFGRVSGDRNPVHTGRWGARLFGVRQPFLQGLGLRSLVVNALAGLGQPLAHFEACFASPATLGQTVQLRVQGGRWEVVADAGRAEQRLVAFGRAL